jgi:hypothetical protein
MRPGVVFSTVGPTVAILSPYVELKSDSRPLISPRMLSSKATPGRLSPHLVSWRERMGIEPTRSLFPDPSPVLKTGQSTSY